MLRIFYLTFIGVILYSNILWAQTDNNNIEERVETNTPIIIRNEDPLIIDENLVLLKKPKFWTAYLLSSTQYTDNVFLNDNNEEHDWISSLTGGVNFNLRTQNNFQFNAGLAASKFYYRNNHSLDYDTLQGNIGLSYAQKNWLGSITYSPALVLEQDFNDRILTLHRFTGSISKSYQLWGRILLSPFSAAHYVAADPHDFSYSQFDTGLRIIYPISSKWTASLIPQTYYKTYDDYFENQTGIQRDDTGVRVNAQLTYKIKKNMSFIANIGYSQNNSTLNNNSYEATSFTPTMQLTYRF